MFVEITASKFNLIYNYTENYVKDSINMSSFITTNKWLPKKFMSMHIYSGSITALTSSAH